MAAAQQTVKKVFVWRGFGSSGETYGSSYQGTGFGVSADLNRFYWNDSSNWFIRELKSVGGATSADSILGISESVTGGYFFDSEGNSYSFDDSGLVVGYKPNDYYYSEANRIPAAGDTVIFQYLGSDPDSGLSGGPWPKSPCLFGGFDRDISNEWHNAGGTGTDLTGYLSKLTVEDSYTKKTDNYYGYNLGFIDDSFYWDGPVWEGLSIRANKITLNSDHRKIYFRDFDGGILQLNGGSDFYLGDGGTADTLIVNVNSNEPTSQDILNGKSVFWNFASLGYFSNTVKIESEYMRRGYLYLVPPTGVTLSNFVYGPSRSYTTVLLGNLNITNAQVKPSLVSTSESFGFSPKFSGFGSSSNTIIDNLHLQNINEKFDIQGNDYYPYVGFGGGATVSNIIMDAGKLDVDELNQSQTIYLEQGKITGNTISLFTDTPYGFIRVGVPGATVLDDGFLIYDEDAQFSFSNGTRVKAFSGRIEGEIDSNEEFINQNTQPARQLLGKIFN